LREPLKKGLQNSDALVVIGKPSDRLKAILKTYENPIFKATPKVSLPESLTSKQSVVAFCGIGYPEKFSNTLKDLDLDIKEFVPFPDHHLYALKEIERLKLFLEQKLCLRSEG
jgi:tetraacyldisaccharide 4'-kinase